MRHYNSSQLDNMLNLIIIFLLIVTTIFGGSAILYTINDIPFLKYFTLLYTIQHIVWLLLLLLYKKNLNHMIAEVLVLIYLSCIIVALFPIICIYWNSGYPIAFFWYVLVPIGGIVFGIKDITMWSIITLIASVSVFFFSPFFPKENFTPSLIHKVNYLTITSAIMLITFFTIVFVKKDIIDKAMQAEALREVAENKEDLEKYKSLYNEIIEYLEKEQPFKNPDFDENMLAKKLHSNTHYISKALNIGGEINFKSLLKKFRINYVKSMIDNDAMKRYTIDYIFTEAGYRSRSTFNNAFKDIVGMTPSDYKQE